MGLLSAFITVDKIDDNFIANFDNYLSNDKIEELINESKEIFDKNRTFISFSKLCILKLVSLFRDFINEKKANSAYSSSVNYINEFSMTPFERKIAEFIAEFDKKEDPTLIKMINVKKNSEVDFGSLFCIYAFAQKVLNNNSKDYNQKQSSELNRQIIDILKKFQSKESDAPFETNNNDGDTIASDNNDLRNNEYFFENAYEFMLFLGMKAELEGELTEPYAWKNAEPYVKKQREAYQANENRDTDKALKLLNECLEINPIGIGARFELVETYIMRKEYDLAKKQLDELSKYINTRMLVAKYYRRYGYISTEEKNYDLALGCFVVSLAFEDSDIAKKEILYLSTQVKDTKLSSNDPFFAIANSNVKFFKNDMKEWTDSEVREKVKTLDDAKTMYKSICDNIATTLPNGESIPTKPSDVNNNIEECNEPKEINDNTLEDNPVEEVQNSNIVEATNEYIYCRKCGTKLPFDSVFCNKCGTKVEKL